MFFASWSSSTFIELFLLTLVIIGSLTIFSLVQSIRKHWELRRKLASIPGRTQFTSPFLAALLPFSVEFKRKVLGLWYCKIGPFSFSDLAENTRTFGTVYKQVIGGKCSVMISDPDMNELLMKKANKLFEKTGIPAYENFPAVAGAHSVFSAPQSLWKHQRAVLNSAFTDQAMEEVARFAGISAQRSIESMAKQQGQNSSIVVDTDDLMARITCDVICNVGFGRDYNASGNGLQGDAAAIISGSDTVQFYSIVHHIIPSFVRKLYSDRVIAKAQQSFTAIVDRAIALRNKNQEDPEAAEADNRKDILSTILRVSSEHAKDQSQLAMSRRELISNCATFLIAGHDTTAGTLRYALYHLAKDPKRQEKLYKYVMETIGDAEEITMDMVNRLNEPDSYVKACFQETQRVTPVVGIIGRTALEDIEFKGYRIPKNTEIGFEMRAVMTDPAIWGADANEYNPERMLAYDAAKNAHIFSPFGIGHRSCIGKRFAMIEGLVVLSSLVRKYRFEPVTSELNIISLLTSKNVTPVLVRFVPRQ